MGRISKAESIRLIHAALDCGVTHLDTARVYGLGDTEQMIGDALKGRPDVSVYTKVGQGPPGHSTIRAHVHAVGRPLARVRARLLRSGVEDAAPAIGFVRHTDFSTAYVRESVETSLKMLRRETLDGLLLHEITSEQATPELVELMETLRSEGKIRRYGVASEPRALAELAAVGLPGDLLQQAGGPFLEPMPVSAPTQIILHSIFGAKGKMLRSFQSWIAGNPQREKTLMEVIASEGLSGIPALLISYTASRSECAGVIFASASADHICESAIAVEHRMSPEGMEELSILFKSYGGGRGEGDLC